MVNENTLNEIKDKIASSVKPEKIILFGSYAKGNQTSESDVDLLVIWDSKMDFHKRNVYLSRLFPKRNFSLDIFAYSKSEAEKLKNIKGTILNEAFTNGKVIYG